MKKIIALALLLLAISGCAGRGQFFGWGEETPRAAAVPYYTPVQMSSPCQ